MINVDRLDNVNSIIKNTQIKTAKCLKVIS